MKTSTYLTRIGYESLLCHRVLFCFISIYLIKKCKISISFINLTRMYNIGGNVISVTLSLRLHQLSNQSYSRVQFPIGFHVNVVATLHPR